MSIYVEKSRCGIAVYDIEESTLETGEVQDSSENLEYMDSLMFMYHPTRILLPSTPQPSLSTYLEEQEYKGEVIYMDNSEYKFPGALHTIYNNTRMPGWRGVNMQEDLGVMSNVQKYIDIGKRQMVGALSALITYLQRILGQGVITFTEVLEVRMEDYLEVRPRDIENLRIVSQLQHPSMMMRAPKKASLKSSCLFGLFNTTCTVQGYKRLYDIFTRPLKKAPLLYGRHAILRFLLQLKESNRNIVREQLHLIPNMSGILSRMHNEEGELLKLHEGIVSGLHILELLIGEYALVEKKNLYRNYVCEGMKNIEREELGNAVKELYRCIDFEECYLQGRIILRYGVDKEYDRLREIDIDSLVSTSNQLIYNTLHQNSYATQFSISYLPHFGWVLQLFKDTQYTNFISQIPCSTQSQLPEEEIIRNYPPHRDWKLISLNEDYLIFHTPITILLQEEYGNIEEKLDTITGQIIIHLIHLFDDIEDLILSLSRVLAEVDAFLSLADAVIRFHLVEPDFHTQNIIQVVGGRNIFTEINSSSLYVPNDVDLNPHKRMVFVTGPNSSGKSVYLTQIGTIVYLAQIGSYVPAISATLGIFDNIFTKFPITESNSSSFSFFMSELIEMQYIMQHCRERSLILIDEFTKGTNKVDGVSILGAILQSLSIPSRFIEMKEHYIRTGEKGSEWLSKVINGKGLPAVIVSTHAHYIYTHNLINSKYVEYYKLDVAFQEDSKGESIKYLYKVIPGFSGSSLANFSARMAGLEQNVVCRSANLENGIRNGEIQEMRRYIQQLILSHIRSIYAQGPLSFLLTPNS